MHSVLTGNGNYAFPPFSLTAKCLEKIEGEINRHIDSAILDNSSVVLNWNGISIHMIHVLQECMISLPLSICNTILKYDAINTAKSAVPANTIPKNQMTLGNQPLISWFMKGVYKSTPPTPCYESTWDVQPVLQHLSSLDLPEKIGL